MAISRIVVRGYGSWGSINDLPVLGYRGVVFVDPTCTITTDVTIASNSITSDVTVATNSLTGNVTISANTISDDVGMGCGNQG